MALAASEAVMANTTHALATRARDERGQPGAVLPTVAVTSAARGMALPGTTNTAVPSALVVTRNVACGTPSEPPTITVTSALGMGCPLTINEICTRAELFTSTLGSSTPSSSCSLGGGGAK